MPDPDTVDPVLSGDSDGWMVRKSSSTVSSEI
jgi:hypothetical protein